MEVETNLKEMSLNLNVSLTTFRLKILKPILDIQQKLKTEPKRAFNTALKKAGIKEKYSLFHLLRHTAGSLWLQGV